MENFQMLDKFWEIIAKGYYLSVCYTNSWNQVELISGMQQNPSFIGLLLWLPHLPYPKWL